MSYVPITVGRRRTFWTILADFLDKLKSEKEGQKPQPAQTKTGAATAAIPAMPADAFRIAIAAALFESIAKTTGFVSVLTMLHPALVLFVFCMCYAAIQPKKSLNLKLFKNRIPRLVAYQAVLACLSALFGISLGATATFILNEYWKLIAFALLVMASLRGTADVRRLIYAMGFAGIVLAFFSVFVVHVSKTNGTTAYDANDIGLIVVMSLPIVLLMIATSTGIVRWICVGGVGLLLLTTVMTASRGAFVGLAAVGISLLLFAPSIAAWKRAVVGVVVAVAGLVFIPAGLRQNLIQTVINPTSDYNYTAGQGRKGLAERGVGYMLHYPIFGLGINNFARAELDTSLSAYARDQAWRHAGTVESAPHNSWVQAGAETGITGLLLWWAIIVGSAWGVLKLRRDMPLEWEKGNRDQRFLYLATFYVPIAVLAFAVCATFVSYAWSDQSYALPAIALGLQLAFAEQMGGEVANPVGKGKELDPLAALRGGAAASQPQRGRRRRRIRATGHIVSPLDR